MYPRRRRSRISQQIVLQRHRLIRLRHLCEDLLLGCRYVQAGIHRKAMKAEHGSRIPAPARIPAQRKLRAFNSLRQNQYVKPQTIIFASHLTPNPPALLLQQPAFRQLHF